MKIIKSGDTYNFYDDSIKMYDKLPPGAYTVEYDEKSNSCYLCDHAEIAVTEKLYGVQDEKIEKVLDAFGEFERSLGVLLSGDKGIGKTMFAKKLCQRACEGGMPVILVEDDYPQLVRFLEKIDQECVVLFDEFEKTFYACKNGYYDDDDEEWEETRQAGLLGLFDGTSGGKKLFVVTCNDLERLDQYLINRPGRFHYHFVFEYPTEAEIEEYLTDKIKEKYRSEIPKVISFSKRVPLNYDCLRAIVFEINRRAKFEDIISDLNILNIEKLEYDVTLHFENGKRLHNKRYVIDLYDENNPFGWVPLYNESGHQIVEVKFNKSKITYDINNDVIAIMASGFKLDFDDFDEDEREVATYRRLKPTRITFERSKSKNLHYFG
ncbi:MAG: AAA family ATPase [Clostridia bacterium]|nr:AAA family ATPase [Clostridia bacterium]